MQALRQAHQCNVAFGVLTPAMVFLAPEAYLVDTSLGFLPPWGKALLLNSIVFCNWHTCRFTSSCCAAAAMNVTRFMSPSVYACL